MVLKFPSRSISSPAASCTRPHKRRFLWFCPILLVCLFFAYKEIQSILVEPSDIFVLGGLEKREFEAAKLAQSKPELQIWVSSGSPKEYVFPAIFDKVGVARDRVHLDYEAQDTVTNFTASVEQLQLAGVDSVYLITSENHMLRARIVGEIVFGSRGIIIKPQAVESEGKPEPLYKTIRDCGRAFFWLFTGKTGVSLKDKID